MITAASTTDPATETIQSGAPFFGGEELGAPTGGTPMEGPPVEVGIEAELGASEGEAGGADVVLKRHDVGKTSDGQRQNGDGRRRTGRSHGRRQSSAGEDEMDNNATPPLAKTNRATTRRKCGDSTATGQAATTRLCSCECEG
ncbi:hypothetical protein PIB30_050910 [Stylosanthes scabra]|uniref:Uncharacterized protein n=1 Tax=Stylosanthes scabra TaxID=79078 RepID=A0ABU6ZGI5_9FABA|nr:hypothetical protein [Stylosanthes scabra]